MRIKTIKPCVFTHPPSSLLTGYVTDSRNPPTKTLLGTSKDDYAGIIRWMSFSNSELFPALCGWFRPLIGKDPYNADSVAEAKKQTLQRLSVLESYLASSAFLVNATPTLVEHELKATGNL